MTRTEDRLADALADAARCIREEALPSLAASERASRGWLTIPGRRMPLRRSWTIRLAPAAAAVAVLTVIGLAARLTPPAPGQVERFTDAATAAAPPPYYIDIEGYNGDVVKVRATATRRVTDRIRPPHGWQATGPRSFFQGFETSAVASAGDRVFVVSYDNPVLRRTALYSFGLTRTGKVTGFAPVPGGALAGLVEVALAVSPDGSRVAVAGLPAPRGDASPLQPARIVVVELRTGARSVWQGGMDRPGQQFGILGVSWTADGKSLVYIAQWCTPRLDYPGNIGCVVTTNISPPREPVALVREISAAGPGGSLKGGHVLLRGTAEYPRILQALVTPDGQLVALVMRQLHPYLVKFAVPGGRPIGVLYGGRLLHGILLSLGGVGAAALASDGSGRYLILNINQGTVYGWVRQGRFRWIAGGSYPSSAW
jgi:hypothetical protein